MKKKSKETTSNSITIGGKVYELNWTIGASMRFEALPKSDSMLVTNVNILWAMLPKGSFENPEAMGDAISHAEHGLILEALNKVFNAEKKTESGE